MAAAAAEKWEGKAMAELRGSTAEDVWPFIEDFCSIHKWLPTIDTSHKVEDQNSGLVRYCAATLPDGGEGTVVKWCRERLVSVDPVSKSLTYEVLENNMGFKTYESTIKVEPIDGGGCRILWSFLADPVEGFRYADLVSYFDATLQGMVRNMERALLESSS